MCNVIYMSNTQQTFKKRMDNNFSDAQRLLKNEVKSDSFAAYYGQHFKSTMSRTDFCKCMSFKLVNQLNPIGSTKPFI